MVVYYYYRENRDRQRRSNRAGGGLRILNMNDLNQFTVRRAFLPRSIPELVVLGTGQRQNLFRPAILSRSVSKRRHRFRGHGYRCSFCRTYKTWLVGRATPCGGVADAGDIRGKNEKKKMAGRLRSNTIKMVSRIIILVIDLVYSFIIPPGTSL